VMMNLKSNETRWYNTFLCYNVGMYYSLYKNKFENFIKKSLFNYIFVLLFFVFAFLYAKSLRDNIYFYNLHSCLFSMIIVLISMKMKIDSKILMFLGNHVFSIYMLQRIVMIILMDIGICNMYLFITLSIIFSLLIAYIFDYIYLHIRKKVFS